MQCAGDPIEIGAVTAVLSGGRVPVRLTAAKARIGHAEPAAGAVGIVHVSSMPERMPCLMMLAL
jgi:acyl transferase domain-containing protein